MAAYDDLLTAIRRLLGYPGVRRLLQLNNRRVERAYEAYVFSLLVEAVRSVGGRVDLVGINSGLNPRPLVFRGGPGSMGSRGDDFVYARCTLNDKHFELHVDVEYEGQSGANHEIDVSICDADHAQDVRNAGNRAPRTNKHLIGAVECKFYDTPPRVALARTFVGLLSDCTINRLDAFVANRTTEQLEQYLSTGWAPEPFVDVSPRRRGAEERFIAYAAHVLRKWSRGR